MKTLEPAETRIPNEHAQDNRHSRGRPGVSVGQITIPDHHGSGYSPALQEIYDQVSRREQLRIDLAEAERIRRLREKARLD